MARERCTAGPFSQGPEGSLEQGPGSVQLDAGLLEVSESTSHSRLPGVEIQGEVVSVAVFVGVLELVESTVLSIQQSPVSGQEVLGDHLFQGHGQTSV